MASAARPIAVFHEHPDWFRPLFSELDRREIPYVRLDAAAHRFDPSERESPYALVVNRASPSAYLRAHGQTTFYTLHLLKHLERLGVPVVNGSHVYGLEISKATQLDLLTDLGLPYPRAVVINDASQAPAAAKGLRFPVLVKANVGGSGAGIVRYDSAETLQAEVDAGRVTLGVDGTALVQESAPLRNGHITRVETLGERRRARWRCLRGRCAEDRSARRGHNAASGDHCPGRAHRAGREAGCGRHRISHR